MKAITLFQPHASLIALGAKQVESRSWATSYRGPLAIHAAKNSPSSWQRLHERGLTDMQPHQAFIDVLEPVCGLNETDGLPDLAALPSGVIVAVATLTDVRPVAPWGDPDHWRLSEQERAFGVYDVGRYAWFLEDVLPLRAPYHPCRGSQRIWNLPDADYLAAIELTDFAESVTRASAANGDADA